MSCTSSSGTGSGNCSCQAMIKSGTSITTSLPLRTQTSGFSGSDPLVIATLRVNTSRFKDPCIKLDFVTNLNVFGMTAGTIKFQVFKQNDKQSECTPIGPPWTVTKVENTFEIISFFVIDCDDECGHRNDCRTYTVVASANDCHMKDMAYVSFTNSTLAATVTSSCD